MTSGYTVSGRGDLDTIFATRVSAAGPATGFLVGGTDLNQRYEPRGSTTPTSNTGYKNAGTDLALLFKDKGALSNTITLSNVSAVSIMAGTATASYSLTSAGSIMATYDRDTAQSMGNWINPLSNFGGFSVRATLQSGTLASGTTGTWLNLGTTRTWTAQASTTATVAPAVMQIEVRSDADSVIRSTAQISLQPYCCTSVLTTGREPSSSATGYSTGRATGNAFGSLAPATILGKTVADLKQLNVDPDYGMLFALESSTALTQSFFSSLKIVPTNGASVFSTAVGAVTFDVVGTGPPMYRWRWTTSPLMSDTAVRYGVVIT